jgi:uncharacterized repeat protein (TIGR01451 family)
MARRRSTAVGIGVGAAALGAAPAAQAAIIEVENLNDAGADSLRAAMTAANANPDADTITFDSSLSGTILLTAPLPVITEQLEIDGPGADEVGIDAYYANARVFEVNLATPPKPVEIRGLSMFYGSSGDSGGGIYNYDSSLTVQGAVVAFNVSTAGDGVSDVIGGGGIAVSDDANADLRVEDSSIVLNSATQGHGGGIGADDGVTIVNSTISGNDAELDGGGMKVEGATVQNSTIADNDADGDGGGIAAPAGGGPAVLQNSIVADNYASDLGPDLIGDFTAEFTAIENTTNANVPTDPSNLIGGNPGLGDLRLNGGPTPTLLPAYDSPVIDQGMTVGGVTTDQRGELRPFDIPLIADSAAVGNDAADMGAVELTLEETTPADLEIDFSQSAESVFVGDPVTYTMEATNNGPEPATGVEIRAFVPDLVTLNSSPGCTAAPVAFGTEVECTIGSLISGATQTRSMGVTALTTAGLVGYTYAYGSIDGDQADPDSYNNDGGAYTVVRRRPTSTTAVPIPPAFNLKAAIKKCKKKFRGKKRANCIKKARKKAKVAVQAGPRHHALRGPEFRADWGRRAP